MKALFQFHLLLFLCVRLNAQDTRDLQPALDGFEYLEVSRGTGDRPLPLLIAFHYSSGTPQEALADYDSLQEPVRIIAPRGNYRKRNGYSYFPVDYYQLDSSAQFRLAKATVDSLAAFVKSIEARYKTRAILSGISQGGDIAFLLAVYYPELCRASFPIAAVIPSRLAREIKQSRKTTVPIYLLQGDADKIVSVDYTRAKVELLSKRLPISLQTYVGVGHEISPQMKGDYSRAIDRLNRQLTGSSDGR